MYKIAFLSNRVNSCEFYPIEFGIEWCKPGHFSGPMVRDIYLLHFIIKGKGIYKISGNIYPLTAGNGFLIKPNVSAYYRADLTDPWIYCWIKLNGTHVQKYLNAAGLTNDLPIFDFLETESILKMYETIIDKYSKHIYEGIEFDAMSFAYHLLAGIGHANMAMDVPKHTLIHDYINKVNNYISGNYHRKITVAEISRYIGLNSKYLTTIYREVTGIPLKKSIINFKMFKASMLLKSSSLSITEIANSVGYDNIYQFSNIFKKKYGNAPTIHRKLL